MLVETLFAAGSSGADDVGEPGAVGSEVRARRDRMIEVINERATVNEFARASEVVKPAAEIGVRAHAPANIGFVKTVYRHHVVAPVGHVAADDPALFFVAKNERKRKTKTFV